MAVAKGLLRPFVKESIFSHRSVPTHRCEVRECENRSGTEKPQKMLILTVYEKLFFFFNAPCPPIGAKFANTKLDPVRKNRKKCSFELV